MSAGQIGKIKLEMGSEEMTLKINKGIGKKRFEEMALMPSAFREQGQRGNLSP